MLSAFLRGMYFYALKHQHVRKRVIKGKYYISDILITVVIFTIFGHLGYSKNIFLNRIVVVFSPLLLVLLHSIFFWIHYSKNDNKQKTAFVIPIISSILLVLILAAVNKGLELWLLIYLSYQNFTPIKTTPNKVYKKLRWFSKLKIIATFSGKKKLKNCLLPLFATFHTLERWA